MLCTAKLACFYDFPGGESISDKRDVVAEKSFDRLTQR